MRNNFKVVMLAGLLSLASAGFSRASTIVHIPIFQDITIFGDGDVEHNASGPGLFVGSDPANRKRAMIEFNVGAFIPTGAQITNVTLTMYVGQVAGSGGGSGSGGDSTPRTIRLFDVSQAWNASTNGLPGATGFGGTGHGATPHTGEATWDWAKFNQVAWTNAGGDFSSTESADLAVGQILGGSGYTWGSTTQMVTDVQGWLDGTLPNNGWLLKNDSENLPTTFRAFYSAEGAAELAGASGFAPKLTVTFNVPEPSSAFALLLALPLLLLRRRNPERASV